MDRADTWQHTTVLLAEAIEALLTMQDGVYVDGTFGRGGHSRALLARLGPAARLIAIDRDPQAVAAAGSIADPRFSILHGRFGELRSLLAPLGVARITGLLLDLGVSSPQIDDPARGFSFRFDGPLDMRMDPTRGQSAAEFLDSADVRQIAEVIREHGEERFAVPIAKALVARREGGNPVRTTRQLSEVVARSVKTREGGQDPATRTFQGLRIHVNAELEELEQGLNAAVELLQPGGRLVVISFHSLEDRIVKNFIARESRSEVDRRAPFAPERQHRLRSLGRVRPGEDEVRANPRARSAVMRVAERTEVTATSPAPGGADMTRLNVMLFVALVFSSLYLVRVSYDSRRLFAELDKAQNEDRALAIEFERLKAERQSQATPLRVEKTAREKLAMRNATPAVTQYVNVDRAASAAGGSR